ncbi:MAG: metalloregulator ArsR/SmtB family transcription factor [Bifidobacteriaceae bacterium]|nr:metalloregulator ArsR/SmtB family transcription factor [Bifidobacteriaceae bacterium]
MFADSGISQVDDVYVVLAAEVFSLLANPTRVQLILELRDGELPVSTLAQKVGKSPTVVSQHLAKLRWAKVVQPHQRGNHVHYSLVDEHARHLVEQAVFQAEHVVDATPRHHQNPTAGSNE